jgi:hypothetical protein
MSAFRAQLPRIFIGSSAERLEVAETIQELLDYETEPTVWSQGIFRPSRFALVDLVRASRSFDFAIFVFAPDDVLLMRGNRAPSVRDNVVFELGLFMGALEPARCFLVVPRESESLHLPTDLLGIEPVTYRAVRSDGSLLATLAPACLKMRRAIRELHPIARGPTEHGPLSSAGPFADDNRIEEAPKSLQDFVAEWNGPDLKAARDAIRTLPFDPYDEEFQKIRPSLKRVFLFLDGLAGAVLSGELDAQAAREHFRDAVSSVWLAAHTLLAPPNHADEWWDPPPKIAELSQRWQK